MRNNTVQDKRRVLEEAMRVLVDVVRVAVDALRLLLRQESAYRDQMNVI